MPEAAAGVLAADLEQDKDLKVAREAPEDRGRKAADRGKAARAADREIVKSPNNKKLLKVRAVHDLCLR